MFLMHPPYGTDIDTEALGRLKPALTAAGYTREAVQSALRTERLLMAQPGEVVVFERRVAGRTPHETLIKFFLIGSTVDAADLAAALPGMSPEELRRLGMAETMPGGVRC